MPMKTDNEMRAALTRIIRASRRVFALDDRLNDGHSVATHEDRAARATLRTAIEDAERLLLSDKR